MAKQLQVRRGTTMANNLFTGAEGEITMDTVEKGLRVHDGSQRGGYKVPTLVAVQYPSATNNYTWYRKYSDGWVEQGGTLTYADSSSNYTVNLPVEMADANYQTSVTLYGNTSGHEGGVNGTYFTAWSRTTTSFVTKLYNAQDIQQMWEVKGMAA